MALAEHPLDLVDGDPLLLAGDTHPARAAVRDTAGQVASPARIGCTCPEALTGIAPGASVWFDDRNNFV